MKIQYLIAFFIFYLFFGCQSKTNASNDEIIYAENIYDFERSIKLNIYTDSSYVFTISEKDPRYEKTEKFKGLCYRNLDTLYFNPFEFEYNDSKKAVIKNNFIEFIDGKYPLKIKIKKSNFPLKKDIYSDKLESYSTFTFNNKFYDCFKEDVKPYDLSEKDIIEIEKILTKCFVENKNKITRTVTEYQKQLIAVKNLQGEIEVWVNCNCKEKNEEFQYSILDYNDGGDCHFNLKINLSKNTYSELYINGEA
ncbi:MAG: hypothetical protein ACOVLG_08020 [Flavobacterium sp.]